MKNDLKYILLTLVLLVGTLTAGAVRVAATGVSGEESQQVEDELAVRVDSVMQQEEREDKAFDPKKTISSIWGRVWWDDYRKGNHSLCP